MSALVRSCIPGGWRRAARLLSASVLVAAAPCVASAQNQPMVFIHGLQNDGSAWAPTADYLAARFAIAPTYPTLGWRDYLSSQEARLNDALGGYTGIPALGHSNGGLIGRYHAQRRGGGARINRLATIGSAHHEAAIANNAINGNIARYAQALAGAVANPVNFYATYDPEWYLARTLGVRWAAHNINRFANYVPFAVAAGIGIDAYAPVLSDNAVGSGFVANLNASTSLATEQGQIASRVGIGTVANPYDIMFQLLSPGNWRDWAKIRRSAYHFAKMSQIHYQNHPDPYLAANAYRWEIMAIRMLDMDLVWHFQIGALQGYVCTSNGCYGGVYDSDGVVPLASQQYPGATSQVNISRLSATINHIQQKNSTRSRQEFESVLWERFGIPTR